MGHEVNRRAPEGTPANPGRIELGLPNRGTRNRDRAPGTFFDNGVPAQSFEADQRKRREGVGDAPHWPCWVFMDRQPSTDPPMSPIFFPPPHTQFFDVLPPPKHKEQS